MTNRKLSGLLSVVLMILLLLLPSAGLADTDSISISNVYQYGGELMLQINQFDSLGNATSQDMGRPESYLVRAAGIDTPAASVSLANSSRTMYTVLVDATQEWNPTAKEINNQIHNFAQSMENEQIRVFMYAEDILDRCGFCDNVSSLDTELDKMRKNRVNKQYNKKTPSMINAINIAVTDLMQSQNLQASGFRHAIIVITDQDAEALDSSLTQKLADSHIPVFIITTGNTAETALYYASASGGRVYKATLDKIMQQMVAVRSILKTTINLQAYPPYDVFAAGSVDIQVILRTEKKTVASAQAYSMTLSKTGVPTPTPSPTPTPKPTPKPTPTPTYTPTPSPTPTTPPTPTPTPRYTIPPTATPTVESTPAPTPEVVTIIITPEPTDTPTPEPTNTPTPLPTVPPTTAPTDTPIPVATPTATPEPVAEGFVETIRQSLGPNAVWIISGAALALIAVIVLIVLLTLSRKKKAKRNTDSGAAYSLGTDGMTTTSNDSPYAEDGRPRNQPVYLSNDGVTTDQSSASSGMYSRPIFENMAPPAPARPSRNTASSQSHQPPVLQEDGARVDVMNSMGMRINFVIEFEGEKQEQSIFIRSKITMGRHQSCELKLPGKSVSRRHAEIICEPDGLYVQDLQSVNGTQLNGADVIGKARLRDGDVMTMGLVNVTIHL